jgi:glycosyltransferase involved in cell wall biosynthesis
MARRLVPEKGTRLAAVAFKRLLELRPHVTITFAGEGADKVFLEQAFSGDGRVDFKVYHPENVVAFHRQYDIAVIPSVCGEATCLAVSEAMAAGCAVMATNMGGTITQILDGYNGILCWPEEENILNGLLRLVDDSTERNMMARRGWESSQTTFCMKGWQARWKAILEEVVQGKKEALAAMRREG